MQFLRKASPLHSASCANPRSSPRPCREWQTGFNCMSCFGTDKLRAAVIVHPSAPGEPDCAQVS
ncbi:hypothetical protein PviCFBP13515_07040 [Pseudomonas viridiflava]|nr:hypothetical protein PviCFBP13507_01925 [Pseudomonas viridiflava]TKK30204.1 hypothetical protein PviCFBP13515_07040 [Pseudomonas viridiflava]